MASRKELSRNNIRTGVFVTISLLLMVAVIVVLSDSLEALTSRYDEYLVSYDVDDGIADLTSGSDVRVGGVSLGRVLSVSPHLVDGEPFSSIDVRFKIDASVALFEDAVVLVNSPLIGADSWLEIPSVGTPAAGSALGATITGTSAPGMLSTLLGPSGAASAGETVENVSRLARSLPVDYETLVRPALEDLSATTTSIRAVVGEASDERWPAWAASIDRVMAWAEGATVSLDETLASGQALVQDGRDVIAENREPVRRATENVRAATENAKGASEDMMRVGEGMRLFSERLNGETIEKAHRLLDRGQEALDGAVAAINTLREDYEAWSVNVGDTMANANLASQQLKLATAEVRRSPWKLLYRPGDQELEHELLYESTRSFAMAAADLKAASESARRIIEHHGDRLAGDADALARISGSLEASVEKYQRAQSQLFDVLLTVEP